MTLKYFMWGWQEHYWVGLNVYAKRVLDKLDPRLQPGVYLVGFLTRERDDRHEICVHPEGPALLPDHLGSVALRMTQLAAADPDREMRYSGTGMQAEADRRLRVRAACSAVAEAMEASPAGTGRLAEVAMPVHIDDYDVFVVLTLDKAAVDAHCCLTKEKRWGRIPTPTSLIRAASSEILRAASRELERPQPGHDLMGDYPDAEQLLRAAAGRLLAAPGCEMADIAGMYGLLDYCEQVAFSTYEGAGTIGRLVLAREDHPALDYVVRFRSPVALARPRSARKVLQLAASGASVVAAESRLVGLALVNEHYDASQEDLFEVHFTRPRAWDLRHAGQVLLEVCEGRIRLPSPPLDRNVFREDAARRLGHLSDQQLDHLWELVEGCVHHAKHGGLLVVSSAAAAESERLKAYGMPIEPVPLDSRIMAAAMNIDGAAILDRDGVCHAIGVILDGAASANGDASRGARFNSAVKYVESSEHACLAIVFSEDGSVDFVPALRPRIRRAVIDQLLARLRCLSDDVESPGTTYNQTIDDLSRVRFYLRPTDADEANKLVAAIAAAMREAGTDSGPVVVVDPFAPDDAFNESYYADAP